MTSPKLEPSEVPDVEEHIYMICNTLKRSDCICGGCCNTFISIYKDNDASVNFYKRMVFKIKKNNKVHIQYFEVDTSKTCLTGIKIETDVIIYDNTQHIGCVNCVSYDDLINYFTEIFD